MVLARGSRDVTYHRFLVWPLLDQVIAVLVFLLLVFQDGHKVFEGVLRCFEDVMKRFLCVLGASGHVDRVCHLGLSFKLHALTFGGGYERGF